MRTVNRIEITNKNNPSFLWKDKINYKLQEVTAFFQKVCFKEIVNYNKNPVDTVCFKVAN